MFAYHCVIVAIVLHSQGEIRARARLHRERPASARATNSSQSLITSRPITRPSRTSQVTSPTTLRPSSRVSSHNNISTNAHSARRLDTSALASLIQIGHSGVSMSPVSSQSQRQPRDDTQSGNDRMFHKLARAGIISTSRLSWQHAHSTQTSVASQLLHALQQGTNARQALAQAGVLEQDDVATCDMTGLAAREDASQRMNQCCTWTLVTNPEPCCICLEVMHLDESVMMTRCHHRLHQPCLRSWFTASSKTDSMLCPLCRCNLYDVT